MVVPFLNMYLNYTQYETSEHQSDWIIAVLV